MSKPGSETRRNITLTMADDDLQRARVLAARRGTSVSALLAGMLRDLVDRDDGYSLSRRRSLELLDSAGDLGTSGLPTWSRDDLHGR